MSDNAAIKYSAPKTGPHHYVCRDALGQPNMIKRDVADAALERMIGDTSLEMLIANFLQRAPKGGLQWHHVRDFLIGVFKLNEDVIEVEGVVAFWAKVIGWQRQHDGN